MTILFLSSIIISICNIILFCVQRKINKLVQEQLELINNSSIDFCNTMSTLNELQRKQIIKLSEVQRKQTIKLSEVLEKLDMEEQFADCGDPYFLLHHRSFQQGRKHNE